MNIVKVTTKDTSEILAIYAPYVENTAISFEYEIPSLEEFASRIENISVKYPYIKAVDENGKILGYAYAGTFKGRSAYDWSVETTVYVKEDCKRMGIGKLLYDALEKSLKTIGILNMNACIAYPETEDEYLTMDSIYFHEKMGFQPVGIFHNSGYKYDRWYHMIWMEKMIGEHQSPQEAVRFGEWDIF
ncbi:MAG: GNAT family N-acetyltransferase [Eubacteriales bacterium]|nr:GNAT family N-acetyltransferase [Eubacteriales bacterium]